MVDLLVARYRLGEPFWPVSKKLNRTYRILRDKGYVEIIDGNVEGTDRLMLTRAARKELIDDSTYVTPIERQTAKRIAKVLATLGGDPTTIRMIESTSFGARLNDR